MTGIVVGFVVAGLVVAAAGAALARFGDAIGAATGIGRAWIGGVLLAGATSLPELVTDVAAVRMGYPDLAVGDLLGSTLANMLILGLIDQLPPRDRVLRGATLDHALVACLAITLHALVVTFLILPSPGSWLGVAPSSVALFLVYIAGVRAVYRQTTGASPQMSLPGERPSLLRAGLGFGVATLVILVAAPRFAMSAHALAEASGLGHTFVGTLLVGLATSLPELVASLAAVRARAFDLAVGNLLGSCAFNVALILPIDAAQPGPLLAAVSPSHVLTAQMAIVLMSLGVAGLVYRARRSLAFAEPGGVLILLGYLVAIGLLYRQHAP